MTKSSDYLLDSSREYSIYVCENRAIPRVTDGLKDAQRKALWLVRNRADKIKTVSLAGDMISSGLYLHGDTSASGAISMMAAPFCNNITLLEGTGSFGTRVSPVDGIGAPRYTYVRRSKIAQEILYKDLDIVPLKDNYDGSTKEPITFLPLIPIVLLNGISGIAVGWSTEILPRSPKVLVDSCIKVLDGKSLRKLIPTYTYLTCKAKHLEENTWEFKGTVNKLNTSTVHVTELPPDLTLDKFIMKLNKLEDDGVIRNFVDKSTDKIDITVKFKLGSIAKKTDEQLIKILKLRSTMKERCVVIDWNGSSIKQYDNAEDIVKQFVDWRLGFYKDRYQKKYDDDSYELRYWKGLKECFDKKLPEDLPKKTNREAIEKEIMKITKTIGLDQKQVDKISSLPTYRWAKDFYQQTVDKIKELEKNIKYYKDLLKHPDKRRAIYREELVELKKLIK